MRAFFALLLLASLSSAFSVSTLDDVASYAEQYEDGQINFLQLKMLLSASRESLIQSMQGELVQVREEEEEARGWGIETATKLLGEPTQYENWVWVENKRESRYTPEKVAVWRKPLFEGKKIRVSVFANPHAIEQNGELLRYYWVDFDTLIPSSEPPLNFSEVVDNFKVLFAVYSQSGLGLWDIALEAAKAERALHGMLEQNAGKCADYLSALFGQQPREMDALRWSGKLHEGEKGLLLLKTEERTEKDWNALNSWIEFHAQGPQEKKIEQVRLQSREEFRSKSVKELTREMERALGELRRSGTKARDYDVLSNTVRLASDTLTEKANLREEGFDIAKYRETMSSLYQKYTNDFVKDFTRDKRFETDLLRVMETVQDRHCEGQETPCAKTEACINAVCAPTKGGNEACQNGVDDDGDTVVDCEDPDCFDFVPCGKKCQPICDVNGGCWPCHGEFCRQECDLCGQCHDKNKGNPEACNSICDACGKCAQAKCSDRCDACWNCEDEYYGSGCRKECQPCSACVDVKGDEQCSAECRECNVCHYRKGKFQCPPDHVFDEGVGGCRPTGEKIEEPLPPAPAQQPQESLPTPDTPQPTGVPEPTATPTKQPTPSPGQPKEDATPSPQPPAPEQPPLPEPTPEPTRAPKAETRALSPFSGLVTGSQENACAEVHCSVNQFCNPEKGQCNCAQGFWDCDGDWLNGCESTSQCKPCSKDSDCALPRCSEDKHRAVNFMCKAGEPREEERGRANIGAACVTKSSGEQELHFWIGAWGKNLDEFDALKQQAHSEMSDEWCKEELAVRTTERLELQKSLNDDFTQWFFKLFVERDVADFEEHARSFWGVYDAFQRVNGDLARTMSCLGQTKLPEGLTPVKTSFNSPIGKIDLWEEVKTSSAFGKPVSVLTPYMKLWIFPTKEQFKDLFRQKIREEHAGPTPAELAQMRRDPKAMEMIRKVSDAFGGEAKILFEVRDGSDVIIRNLNTVNPSDLVKAEFVDSPPGDVDVTLAVDYDFLYATMEDIIKELEGGRIQQPWWEEQRPFRIDEAIIPIKMFGRLSSAVFSGKVRVEPFWELPKIIGLMGEMGSLFAKQ